MVKSCYINTLCSGFCQNPLLGVLDNLFPYWYLYRNRYKCVESETFYKKYDEKKIGSKISLE